MDEQEEKNQASAFEKQSYIKASSKLDDIQRKSKKAKKIVKFIKAKKLIIPLLIILGVIIFIVFWGGIVSLFYNLAINSTNTAKKSAISVSYSSDSSTSPDTGTNNDVSVANTSRIVVKPAKNKNAYEISNNYTDEEIKELRENLENETSRSLDDFSDFEIAIIGALAENGLDIDDWNLSELKCFPAFIKAEACTQYLDLRSNKIKETTNSADNYKPQQLSNLDENEVPGTILVQRTSTKDNKPVVLEYMEENNFNKLVDNNDEKAIDYFTVNDKGNLIIAKWEYTYITVKGKYPENIDEAEKQQPEDSYTITTEEIAYSQYISKYTMPFELLVQLLGMLEDTDFCMELVDYVLGSKIIINIQEEETLTVTDQVNDYTIHDKDEKRINYNVTVAEEIVASESNHFLNYSKDDEKNECTNYESNETQVTIHTEITSHSYVFEISEADTWLAHYIKTYQKQDSTTEKSGPTSIDMKGKYKELEETNITEQSEITKDKDVKAFISENKSNYEEKIPDPVNITITNGTDENGNNFKQVHYINSGSVEAIYGLTNGATVYYEVKDSEGNGTGEYNLPGSLAIKMKEVPATENTARIPPITYIYVLSGDKYVVQNSGNGNAEIEVTKLNINNFEKIDLIATMTTTTTKYPADPNPTTNTHIYATKSGKPGTGNGYNGFEKFLIAYDNNKRARHMMNSIASWLFESMEEDESTVEFIDTIKYLLYMYDGINYGVTELEDFENTFNPDDFIVSTGGSLVVKTDATGALQELTRDEVEKVIKKRFSGQAKDNLLSSLDAFMYIQETYHVNAIFAIAVTQKECSCGTNLQIGGYNWYSIKGSSGWKKYSSYDEATRDFGNLIANSSYYFKAGNYTVDSIGNVYCVPPEGWIKSVLQYIKEMYESIGITVISGGGNEIQQKVVEVAKDSSKYGIPAISGYCQAWVSDVYLAAGANKTRASACCAVHAGAKWGVSTDWSQIQVGAAVYGYASQTYGHVGIYIGNGMVAHNRGGVKYDSLESWIKGYKGVCWGWNGGTDLTGGSYPCKTGLMTPSH